MTINLLGSDKSRPVYLRIADAIGREIESGSLRSGQRLPTHRALAATLGLTITTITRAYAEAARRGLIDGEVGRGLFVRAGARRDGRIVDLASDDVLGFVGEEEVATICRDVGRRLTLAEPTADELLAAAAEWLGPRGVVVTGERLVVTAGARQALLVALAALVPRGGRVLVEDVTYAGLRQAASLLGIELVPVPLDDHGLVPDALEACASAGARTLYLTPCVQEPTGVAVPASRRAAIAAVVRRVGLTVIEDDALGFLGDGERPLAADMPDRVVHVATLAACVGPACRAAFVAAPAAMAERLRAAQPAAGAPVPALVARLACRAIAGGLAFRLAATKRALLAARVSIARDRLPVPPTTAAASPHVWLPLPRGWKAESFAAHAAERGVRVRTAEASSARHGVSPRAVRLSIGAPAGSDRLEEALTRLRDLAAEAPPLQSGH